jgi:tripartite-type tricarboxylate transporter receptor subunit TctC
MTRLLAALLAALLVALGISATHAQPYPSKPIRIVVPVATGGIADYYSRVIGKHLGDAWGQPVVVENRPGGGGNIGADIVAKSAPDGYNLVMGFVGSHAVNQFLFAKMPYDTGKDFAAVVMVIEAEGLLAVHPSVPINSVADLLAYARANPGKLSYGSGGIGTSSHLAGELFKSMTKTNLVHVPYKGNAPALADLIGGQTHLQFATLPTVIPHVRAGKLRGIAVIGNERSAAAPALPTIAESGVPGFSVNNWIGLFAPAGTPADLVRRWNTEVNRIMQLPEVKKRMDVEGERYTPNTPEQFGQFVRADAAKWEKVVKEAGLKAE